MIILALDTASRYCSAALMRDGEIIAEQTVCSGLVHSRTLMVLVDNVLKSVELEGKDVDAFACSNGPGSFTGIRIAVSTVKGLALAGNKPCVGVSTLQAAAEALYCPDTVVCAILDARCSQVYAAAYLNQEAVIQPAPMMLTELLDKLEGYDRVVFCGDGISVHGQAIKQRLGAKAELAPAPQAYQRAASVASVAQRMLDKGESVSCFELDANYLRLSQAEREYAAKHGNG